MNERSTSAARKICDCHNCGLPVYEYLVHHCGTALRFPTTAISDRLPTLPSVVPVLPEIEPVRAQGRVPKVQLHEQAREAKGDDDA